MFSFPLRDHFHQAVVGGYVLTGARAALPSSRVIRGTSQPLDSRHRRDVSLVMSVTARVLAYQGKLPGRPCVPVRSDSLLRFGLPCHERAVN